jgi:hypothetical protein
MCRQVTNLTTFLRFLERGITEAAVSITRDTPIEVWEELDYGMWRVGITLSVCKLSKKVGEILCQSVCHIDSSISCQQAWHVV